MQKEEALLRLQGRFPAVPWQRPLANADTRQISACHCEERGSRPATGQSVLLRQHKLCFGLAYLPCLAGLALAFSWFPREKAGAWLIFVGIFLVIFAAVALSYGVAFRIKGAKYNGLLGQYKKNLEK